MKEDKKKRRDGDRAYTYGDLLHLGRARLEAAGVVDADIDARLLLEHVTGLGHHRLFMDRDRAVSKDQSDRYEEVLFRRACRIPLQHITGEAWFYGYPFFVSGDVLIPRPDTELLVEEALSSISSAVNILDLCTGSGCVLLSVLLQCRERGCEGVTGIGTDLSQAALDMAAKNRERLGVREAELFLGDLFEPLAEKKGAFDLITANPPYIARRVISTLETEVRDHDPMLALDGGEEGLDLLMRIAEEAPDFLTDGGWLIMEMGYDQGPAMRELLERRGFGEVEIKKDLAGLDRVVRGRWLW